MLPFEKRNNNSRVFLETLLGKYRYTRVEFTDVNSNIGIIGIRQLKKEINK